eukprot:186732-Alexandrium_andersonii.AAC.1
MVRGHKILKSGSRESQISQVSNAAISEVRTFVIAFDPTTLQDSDCPGSPGASGRPALRSFMR